MADYEYKLSVVVIVYNTEDYLEECLDSLVNQTLDDIEIICVNDESTDNSLNILKQYAKRYDNISVISQKNQGGAVAGNTGLKQAKGEYVALIDSDDVVVLDAYEKLYTMAKKTDSDIVSGQPVKYVSGYQREITVDYNIWNEEKTFTTDDNLEIFYDVFYWNKIYKRELIQNHEIYMIPGKIYADVPLVFKSYLYADKISVIPDIVYYWRRRSQQEVFKANAQLSVSRSLLNIPNMEDRLSTYYYLKDYFKQANKEKHFNHVIKTYFKRFFLPIEGILKDNDFKNAFLSNIKPILEDIDDVYDNKLDLRFNLYIYFILNDLLDELNEFLNFLTQDQKTVTIEGITYWGLKFFNNPEYDLPKDLFKIKKLESNFIQLDVIAEDSNNISIKNVNNYESIPIDKLQICLIPLTKKCSDKFLDTYFIDFDESFSLKIKRSDLKNINIYDVYLNVIYQNGFKELIRIKKHHINNLSDVDFLSFSKADNFRIINNFVDGLFDVEISDESIKILPPNDYDINYRIFIKSQNKVDLIYFDADMLKKEFELEWKYCLDSDVEYKLYIQMDDNVYKLTKEYFADFNSQKIGNIDIECSDDISIIMKL